MTAPDEPHPWGWTAARRAKQSQAIHRWQPWRTSTGPVTPEGKTRAAQNASKPSSVRRQVAGMMAELKAVLRLVKVIKAKRPSR